MAVRAQAVTTLTMQPTSADSEIAKRSADANRGTDTTMGVRATSGILRAPLQFDLSALPTGARVIRARLSLYMSNPPGSGANPSGRTHELRCLSSSWTEGGVTWNSRDGSNNWTAAGGDYLSTGCDGSSGFPTAVTGTSVGWVTWTVTNDVRAWTAGGVSNYGWVIRDASEGSGTKTLTDYYTRDYTVDSSLQPKLEVEYLENATRVHATASGTTVTIYWKNPGTAPDYAGVLVVRKAGSAPTFAPVDGTTYSVGEEPVAGEYVVCNICQTSGTLPTSCTDPGPLSANTEYYYAVYARDARASDGSDNCSPTGGVTATPNYYVCPSGGTSCTYVTDTNVSVVTADGSSSSALWTFTPGTGATLAPPSLLPSSGVVLTVSNDNRLATIAASDGVPLAPPFSMGGSIQRRVAAVPASLRTVDAGYSGWTGDIVYTGASDGYFYGVRAQSNCDPDDLSGSGCQVFKSNAGNGVAMWPAGGPVVYLQKVAPLTFCPSPPASTCSLSDVTTDVVITPMRTLFSSTANALRAYRGDTGALVWQYQGANPAEHPAMSYILATPLIDYAHGALWAATHSAGGTQPSIWKFDVSDGSLLASITDSAIGDIEAAPTADENFRYVFFGTKNGKLVAVDATTVTVVATYDAADGAVKTGILVVGSQAGSNPTPSTPDVIYFTTQTKVHKVTFDGSTFSQAAAPIVSVSSPTAPMGNFQNYPPAVLYVGSSNSTVYKIDTGYGASIGTFAVDATSRSVAGATFSAGPAAFDTLAGKIYFGGSDGHVYAFSAW